MEQGNGNESYQKLFLRGYPVNLLLPVVMETLNQQNDFEAQHAVLNNTISLPLVKQYPLRIEYMRSFLKSIIFELEKRCIEVSETVYETLCQLLNIVGDRNDTHYKHYMFGDTVEKCISIEESASLISVGSTGLCTWQASQNLVNWCTAHKDKIKGKRVLELGSGIGLAGLAIIWQCEPATYWFSDGDSAVLGLLISNVELNVNRNRKGQPQPKAGPSSQETASKKEYVEILYKGKLKETDIRVISLEWDEVSSSTREMASPDIILASDVVYDTADFIFLVNALCHLVTKRCPAVVACTVRDEDTLANFMGVLGAARFCVEVEEPVQGMGLVNMEDVPVRIYKISRVPKA